MKKYLLITLPLIFIGCGGSSSSSTTTQNNVTLSISHNSFSYNIISSPITGKKWLDRNLGASEVCTKSRDDASFSTHTEYITSQNNCFGDLYQWGRLTDGHEKNNSSTIATRAASITSAGVNFITNNSTPVEWLENTTQDTNNIDDNGSLRTIQWSKIDGTSVCPVGFRVPTSSELYNETILYSGTNNENTGAVKITNRDTAFKNFLKFPVPGYSANSDGSLNGQGQEGVVWSSSTTGVNSYYLDLWFGSGNSVHRANGYSVRCIQD